MKMIMISIEDVSLGSILQAVQPLVPDSQIKVLDEQPLPIMTKVDDVPDELTHAVATAIRSTKNQLMRREALRFALCGGDTFSSQWLWNNGPDHKLRAALGALSKALRSVFPHDRSPIDRIAKRTKHFNKSDGCYLGTRYDVTPLGVSVSKLLKSWKEI